MQRKIVLTFDADAKLYNFNEKVKTASGKCRTNIVTLSFLSLAVNVILNFYNDLKTADSAYVLRIDDIATSVSYK